MGQGHDHPALLRRTLEAADAHWVAGAPPAAEFRCTARVRYRQQDVPVRIRMDTTDPQRFEAVFDEPVRAVTPGQSIVLHDGQRCLGGAVIETPGASLAPDVDAMCPPVPVRVSAQVSDEPASALYSAR